MMNFFKTKYLLVMLALVSVFTSCGDRSKDSEQEKPNMVFILTDDQAWNMLGKDGRYSFMETPNLDRLSREGMVFENAFVTTSLCSPSRASFLTGCYAHKHGVYVNTYSDPDPDAPYLPQIMQDLGYETAFVGKWHMGDGDQPRKGFDYWLSFEGQGEYIDPPLNENGREFTEEGYMTDILTDYAIKWIKKDRNKPFCLFLFHKAIHAPFTPAPRDSVAFPGAQIPEYDNWYDNMADKPRWLRRGVTYGVHNEPWRESEGKPVPEKIDPEPWDPENPQWMNYMRAMLAVDESYGNIVDCIEEKDLEDQTMMVYSSDNGFFLGAHQRGDKRLMYEESIRIPLLIKYPNVVKPGSKNSEMVLNIDIAPTFVDMAGGTVPEDMQGRSLEPLLKNKEVDWRDSFLYEYFQEAYAPGLVTMLGVRTKDYKYITFPDREDDINELYDLQKDPGEMNNVINDPEYQDVLSKMKAELSELKEETGYFDPNVYDE